MKLGLWMLVKEVELKPERVESKALTAAEAAAILAWKIKAGKAAGELYLAVQGDQRTYLSGIENDPVAIWTKLESVHLQKHPGSRFLSNDTFFSIQKKEDESLTSRVTRIDKGMIQIKNLRPKDFKLEDLDEELVCMAMIRALLSEFDSFASSLQLLDKLEKFKLQESFIAEELRRQCTLFSPALQVTFFASHTSNNLSTISQQASTSSCDFCGLPGHSALFCYRYKAARGDATKEALEKHIQRNQKSRGPPGTTQKANTAQTLPSSSSHYHLF